jgi:dolichyl-phosphate beta-glucosyltransferase
MRIDIAIPAYNEEAIIEACVSEIRSSLASLPHTHRIIVANNGSSDRTGHIARGAGATVLEVPVKGKGAALSAAARLADAPYFAFIDADLSAHPRELARMLAEMESSGADIVIGSRLADESAVHRAFLRTLSSQLFNTLRRLLLGIGVMDTQCGLKLMNEKGRALLAECEETGWFLDMEFLARAERAGLRIIEIPVEWTEFYFKGRASKLALVRDGVGAGLAMLRIRRRLS